MELMIYSPETAEALPEIKWNYEEIKKYALEKAQEYKSIAYTDSDAAAMKKDRADINRFITALENERKNKKKEYMAPYAAFEAQVKDALAPLREASDLIGRGLNEIEEQYRAARKEKMREFYEKYSGDLRELIPFDKTVKEEYYKRAFTDKKLEQGYIDFFTCIREELKALDELPERFRDKAALKYMESFSLSDALREGKRLEEIEKAMEERRKRQEEERAAREAERMAPEVKHQEAGQISVTPAFEQQTAAQAEKPSATEKTEPIMSLCFRAWGTKEQLMALRNYMIEHNIKFGKVE